MLWLGISLNYAMGQQKQIDSLTELVSHSEGKEQINLLLKIADIYLTNNPEKSIYYSELAIKKANTISDKYSVLAANEIMGNAHLLIGNIEQAYKYFNLILDELPPFTNIDYSIELLTKKGKIYANIGEFDKAILCYQNSLKMAEKNNDSTAVGFAYNNLGYIYFLMQDNSTAIKYFRKALACFISQNNMDGISDSYNHIGIIYGIKNSNDSALYCFYKSLSLLKQSKSSTRIISILDNIGEVYLQKNMLDSSLFYFNKAYELVKEKNDMYGEPYILNYLGKIYIAKGNYKKALETLDLSKKIALKLKFWYISEIYATYSELYAKTNDYKNAYHYLKLYYTVKDSIFNVKKKHKVSELQVKYETIEKEKKILSLNKDNELIQMNLKRKNVILILSALVIIIITIFAFVIYAALQIKNKTNRMLNIKNKEIEIQRQEISLKNRILETQKNEIYTQKESLEETNTELEKINVYLEKLSNRNIHTDLAVLIANENGVVENVNLGFFNMFGYSSLEFPDFFNSIFEWFGNEDIDNINLAIKTKESVNFETIHKSKSNHTLFVQTTILPITDISGKLLKIIVIETEITKY